MRKRKVVEGFIDKKGKRRKVSSSTSHSRLTDWRRREKTKTRSSFRISIFRRRRIGHHTRRLKKAVLNASSRCPQPGAVTRKREDEGEGELGKRRTVFRRSFLGSGKRKQTFDHEKTQVTAAAAAAATGGGKGGL